MYKEDLKENKITVKNIRIKKVIIKKQKKIQLQVTKQVFYLPQR